MRRRRRCALCASHEPTYLTPRQCCCTFFKHDEGLGSTKLLAVYSNCMLDAICDIRGGKPREAMAPGQHEVGAGIGSRLRDTGHDAAREV